MTSRPPGYRPAPSTAVVPLTTTMVRSSHGREPCSQGELLQHFEREAFTAREVIRAPKLHILDVGVCAREGELLTEGAHWGDILVNTPALRDTREVCVCVWGGGSATCYPAHRHSTPCLLRMAT